MLKQIEIPECHIHHDFCQIELRIKKIRLLLQPFFIEKTAQVEEGFWVNEKEENMSLKLGESGFRNG